MVLSKTYIALLVAFLVGVMGAVAFSVHAQSVAAGTSQQTLNTGANQLSDNDNEQVDEDQNNTDVETNDAGTAVLSNEQHEHESEDAADANDTEIDD